MFTLWILLSASFRNLVLSEEAKTEPPNEWCAPELECDEYRNTLCAFSLPEEDIVNFCYNQTDAMTDADRKKILGLHNYLRNALAGGRVRGWKPAANMRQLTWDDDLAKLATMWAFQCLRTSINEPCRKTKQFNDIGQNNDFVPLSLYPRSYEGVFIRGWAVGAIYANPSIVSKYEYDATYYRFVNTVWANSYKIGCGYIKFVTVERDEHSIRIVCNYAPEGNKDNEPVYIEGGTSCEKCPSDSKCYPESTYPHLCALPTDPKDEVPVPVEIEGLLANTGSILTLFLSHICITFSVTAASHVILSEPS